MLDEMQEQTFCISSTFFLYLVIEPSVTSSPLDIASSRQRKQGANTPTNIPPLSLPPPISHRGSHRGNLPPAVSENGVEILMKCTTEMTWVMS